MSRHSVTAAASLSAVALLLVAALSGCAIARPSASSSSTVPTIPTTSDPNSVVKKGQEWVVFQGAQSCTPGAQEKSGICLARPDGTGRHPMPLGGSGEGLHPDWSPDGSKVAYSIDGETIWTSSVDGSHAKQVAAPAVVPDGNGADFPAWSPDGTRIAYTVYVGSGANGPDRTAIEVLDLASGKSSTAYETASTYRADQPRWSHDGTRLVIQIEHVDATGDDVGASIDVVPASGGNPVAIVPESFFGTYPDWNPTRDQIVFTRNEYNPAGGAISLYLVNADGTGLAPVVFDGSTTTPWRHPSWTPDGKQIIFVQWNTHATAMVKPDGSGLVVNSAFTTTHPRLRPLP